MSKTVDGAAATSRSRVTQRSCTGHSSPGPPRYGARRGDSDDVRTGGALLGLSSFFLAVGIGGLTGLQDLPEEELGILAWLPVLGFGFGFLSLPPALALTAHGAGQDALLPRWGVVALWVLAPMLVVVFVLGGNGPTELVRELAAPVGLVAMLLGWAVVGLAVGRADRPSGHTRTSGA